MSVYKLFEYFLLPTTALRNQLRAPLHIACGNERLVILLSDCADTVTHCYRSERGSDQREIHPVTDRLLLTAPLC